ncbi:MAG TPA: hypothetical protein PK771_13070 [Spirochaetota bacterium]|nr:hypothetical protein [Spirochaetota bacterium]
MRQFDFLKNVISVLNKYKIDYMLTGSIVSSIQGEPRSTHDIDIIVHINSTKDIKLILNDYKSPDFYLDAESIDESIKSQSMFNLIDTNNGEKADFWILTNSDFDKSRFERKILQKIENFGLYISTPEDTILAKLLWSKNSGGSKKQFIDALRIYEVQKDILDINYIELWAKKLDVTEVWQEIMKKE